MSKLDQIVEDLSALTVLEASELAKLLEDKWGVSAAAPVVQATAAAAAEQPDAAVEKTDFNVVLKSVGQKKISVIKTVREIFGVGLKEAKEMVDTAPNTLKEAVVAKEAEEIKKKLEEAGAEVELT